jgi:O-antigen ligase
MHASNYSISDLQTFSGRTGIWNIVLENWNDRGMVFGHQGQYTLEDYSSDNFGRSIFFHAHNLILQYLWDWGLIGLFLALIFLFFVFQISHMLDKSGYLLCQAIVTAGLIEITVPNTLLAPKFAFILLFVKCIASIKKPLKDVKPQP